MSKFETVRPRRKSRLPTQADVPSRPVEQAVAEPLPDGLAAAIQLAQQTLSAFNDASTLRNENEDAGSESQARLEALKNRLHEAHVQFQVVEMRRRTVRPELLTEEDLKAPTAEVVKRLQDELDAEISTLSRRDEHKAAFNSEVARRREAAAAAARDLRILLAPWKEQIVRAAEEQLSIAARMIEEAYATVAAVQPWRRRQRVVLPKVADAGNHQSTSELVLPANVLLAVGLIQRGQ